MAILGLGKRKAGVLLLLVPLFQSLSTCSSCQGRATDSTLYMQIPQTHLKQKLEMSPDRYIHTRGVYCCVVMWHGFQIVESSERAKDKASIYAFHKYVVRLPVSVVSTLISTHSHSVEVFCKVSKKF